MIPLLMDVGKDASGARCRRRRSARWWRVDMILAGTLFRGTFSVPYYYL